MQTQPWLCHRVMNVASAAWDASWLQPQSPPCSRPASANASPSALIAAACSASAVWLHMATQDRGRLTTPQCKGQDPKAIGR